MTNKQSLNTNIQHLKLILFLLAVETKSIEVEREGHYVTHRYLSYISNFSQKENIISSLYTQVNFISFIWISSVFHILISLD